MTFTITKEGSEPAGNGRRIIAEAAGDNAGGLTKIG